MSTFSGIPWEATYRLIATRYRVADITDSTLSSDVPLAVEISSALIQSTALDESIFFGPTGVPTPSLA